MVLKCLYSCGLVGQATRRGRSNQVWENVRRQLDFSPTVNQRSQQELPERNRCIIIISWLDTKTIDNNYNYTFPPRYRMLTFTSSVSSSSSPVYTNAAVSVHALGCGIGKSILSPPRTCSDIMMAASTGRKARA